MQTLQNSGRGVVRRSARQVESLHFNSGWMLELPRSCDVMKLLYLTFESGSELTMALFREAMKDESMNIQIGAVEVQSLPVRMMMELNEVRQIGTSFVITVPDFLVREFGLVGMRHSPCTVSFPVHNYRSVIRHVYAVAELCYVSEEERREYIESPFTLIYPRVLNYITHKWGASRSTNLTHSVRPSGLAKGLFIEGNIALMEHMRISIDGREIVDFNETMLGLFCHRISERLHYLSFSNVNDFATLSLDSFASAANFTTATSAELNLSLKPTYLERAPFAEETLLIHTLIFDELQVSSGVAGLSSVIFAAAVAPIPAAPPAHGAPSAGWATEVRPLDAETECPITGTLIADEYGMCGGCGRAFDFPALTQWLRLRNRQTCPLCRRVWTNFVMYVGAFRPTTPE